MATTTIVTSSTTNNLGSSGTTTVVTKPTGTVDGDLLVVIIGNRTIGTKTVASVPSGWTLIKTETGATNKIVAAYWKIASSEPTTWTWTWTASGFNAGSALRINGNDPSSPIDVNNSASTADGVTSLVFTDTVTPTKTNQLILFPVFASRAATGLTDISAYAVVNNNPTWTELYDIGDNSSNSFEFTLAYATYTVASATGNSTATAGASAAGEGAEGLLIVIARQTAFTTSIADTETASENVTVRRGRVISTNDTETTSDTTTTVKGAGWTNQTKNTSTWNNQTKH